MWDVRKDVSEDGRSSRNQETLIETGLASSYLPDFALATACGRMRLLSLLLLSAIGFICEVH